MTRNQNSSRQEDRMLSLLAIDGYLLDSLQSWQVDAVIDRMDAAFKAGKRDAKSLNQKMWDEAAKEGRRLGGE